MSKEQKLKDEIVKVILRGFSDGVTCEVKRVRDWASVLFSGIRITIEIRHPDEDDFEVWLSTVSEWEPGLRGHFLASCDLIERGVGYGVLELLLMEE